MRLPSFSEFHGPSRHGFTAGHELSTDPGLHISNHIASRPNSSRSNLSLSTNDASVTVPLCLAP